jgi:hypothetical protein
MPPRIELEHQYDFGGGLNLADDPTKLADNESFDLQNVDIDRRGGFGVRRGSRRYLSVKTQITVTATGASRTGNVVTAVGLSPVNGAPNGLVVGEAVHVTFQDATYNGTFTVTAAAGGGTTATWAQTAANDVEAGTGTLVQGLPGDGTPDSGYSYVDPTDNIHILASRGGHTRRWNGSGWNDVIVLDSSGRTLFAEMLNTLYVLPPNRNVPYTWTGSGLATQLTTVVGNYNDNLAAPDQGNFPQCTTMAVFAQSMWAGNVVDTGGTERCRVRWSHPGQPQDWRTNDFIDLDKDDENGEITALVPFGDRLLVFKQKAIYAIHGAPPAGFSVTNLTKEVGTPSHWSVVATEKSVYFWDIDTGAWSYDGKDFTHIFRPLYPLIDDNKINNPFSFVAIVEFHNERLWVSVPMLAPPYQNNFVSLVYDEFASKNGAWTIYDRTGFGWWKHRGSTSGGDVHLIGGLTNGFVYEFDVENLFEDQVEASGAFRTINAWYTTRWFDDNNSAMKKRWKRPILVMRGGANQETLVDVLTDYEPAHVTRSFSVFTVEADTEGVWDVDDWDVGLWAAETSLSAERALILRGSPLGNGTSKALRLRPIEQGRDWRVHRLVMKWIPKRIRN